MRFFFDRNTCVRTARMLAIYEGESGHQIIHHNDRFERNTPDEAWLRALAREDPKWVVISGDGAILKNRAQMAVLSEVNLTYFCLAHPWCNSKIEETAWRFIKLWPEIVRRAQVPSPTIFEIRMGRALKIEDLGPTRR